MLVVLGAKKHESRDAVVEKEENEIDVDRVQSGKENVSPSVGTGRDICGKFNLFKHDEIQSKSSSRKHIN